MKSLRRILRYIAPYKWDAIWALVLLLGVVAADLGIPRLTQRVIDAGIGAGDMRVIVNTSLLMMVAAVVSALFCVFGFLAGDRRLVRMTLVAVVLCGVLAFFLAREL